MKTTTFKAIDDILSMQLFRNVGKLSESSCITIHSWKDAINSCLTIEWKNTRQEACNEISAAVFLADRDASDLWNDKVVELDNLLEPKLNEQIMNLGYDPRILKVLHTKVGWDLGSYGMELEYQKYIKTDFYSTLAKWYKEGHFPCGWEGEYPEGRLMVF